MPSFPISLFLLPLLILSSTTSAPVIATHNRRVLHEPFVPEGSKPPTQPPAPQPPTPKYPFSTTTPNNQPFFPSIPTPPSSPSPPSPSSFASFPANISSLILPQSSKSKPISSKLVAVAVVLSISAVIVTGISVFLYLRRRKRLNSTDGKSSRSDISNAIVLNANGLPHHRRSAPNSSEFLYLGNIATSCAVAAGGGDGGDVNLRKLDSPELRPLPPLRQQSFRPNYTNAEVGSEDEEFYSPRGSSAGRESSIGTGSASRRTFAAAAAENYGVGHINGSSSSLYSSSNSGSPISSSPPVSLSPIGSRPKSPELVAIQTVLPPRITTQLADAKSSPSLSPPSSSSPERGSEKSLVSSPGTSYISVQNAERISPNHTGNVLSPSLSPLSSPERPLEKNDDLLPGIPNDLNQNVESPVRTSSASSIRLTNDENLGSPSLSLFSLGRDLEKTHDLSPRISDVSDLNVESPVGISSTTLANKENSRSPSLSSSSSSSPERSTGISYVLNPNVESPAITSSANLNGLANKNSRSPSVSSSASSSPERYLEKTQDSSSEISHVSSPKAGSPASVSNSTPRPRRHWEIPVSHDSSPLEKTHDSSPRISNVMNQNLDELANQKHSRTPSQSPLSSPERPLEKTPDSSKRISNVSDPNAGSPARISKSAPPPPPLPPPLPLFRKHWEIPVSTQSIPLISKPPVLVTAPRPVTIPSPPLIPPVELPHNSENAEEDEETEKPKLKPLHWDKVRASSDREMVWDQLKSSSFKLDEEMIETLFVVNKPSSNHKEANRRYVLPSPSQENRVLDPKKAQNIAISLRALNVTIEEVCEALSEGNADALGAELLESLLKMAPTKEEEHRLKAYQDNSPFKLGPAEKFLKAVLDIPYAFKRAEALLYIANFESEVEYLKKSFETLEAACEELRNSRMFFKLLEAVLKTGNRMNVGTNRGDAHAFKLDTLLKLVDVKGADGKTTLLHFVVQEIIRSEGARLSSGEQNPSSSVNDDAKCRKLGLQVVSDLSSELKNVKKSAAMDSDVLSSEVMKLFKGIGNIAEIVRLNEEMGSEESIRKFSESMKRFTKMAEEEIYRIQAQESVSLSLVKEITEYFHGNSAKEEAHPFRIFMVVRDFLTILDRVCKEVGMINERTIVSSAHKFPVPVNPMMQPLVSGFRGRRQYSFSDDENSSP